jgi:hypothetical protein
MSELTAEQIADLIGPPCTAGDIPPVGSLLMLWTCPQCGTESKLPPLFGRDPRTGAHVTTACRCQFDLSDWYIAISRTKGLVIRRRVEDGQAD